MHMKIMGILLFGGGICFIYLLGPPGLMCVQSYSFLVDSVWIIYPLLQVGALKSPTITVLLSTSPLCLLIFAYVFRSSHTGYIGI